MSKVVRFAHFLPVERSKFLSAIENVGLDAGKFEVSKMEIAPPLMPGHITALVTVKLASSAIAFSYEDGTSGSWVDAFQQDLRVSRFDPLAHAMGLTDFEPEEASRQGLPFDPAILTTGEF